jgi:Transposase DDE domain
LPRLRRDEERKPVSVKELAVNLPKQAFEVVEWRQGSNDVLKGRFAPLRVHAAHRGNLRSELRLEEWLVIEWPETDDEPANYWLSTLPEDIAFDQLVDAIKLRWRIEGDYQELKQEVGLGHYEGRGWRGFHHHVTLCIAAYGFLIAERETIPPSGHPRPGRLQTSAVSPVPDPRDPPLRPERHVANSIPTLRRRIAAALAHALPRCPCRLRLQPSLNLRRSKINRHFVSPFSRQCHFLVLKEHWIPFM